jgi:hypothetical protein
VNEAKDSLTSWADEVNTNTDHSADNSQAHTDYMLNTGDVAAGAYDFGDATSVELPNGTAPAPDADGEVFVDTDDEWLEIDDGTNDRAIPTVQTVGFQVNDPEDFWDEQVLVIWANDADGCFGSGIQIVNIKTTLSADATDTLVFWEMSEATDSLEFVATVDSFVIAGTTYKDEQTSFSDAAIAANNWLVCRRIGSPDLDYMRVQVSYYINDND